MKRMFLTGLLSALFTLGLFSATVDTLKVFSPSMNKEVKTVVIIPQSYNEETSYPVLYLLHGYSGRYDSWIGEAPHLTDLADRYEMLIVCPDGGYGSWYWDSPEDPTFRYETFVARELIDHIDNHYHTSAVREGRAITGLSMGGHGGLYLGFRNQEVFGACGSMCGGVDISPFPDNWDMAKRLGALSDHPERWKEYSVMGQLHRLRPNGLKIIFDCGTDDFFHDVNQRLHKELLYRNIAHDFISRPGRHNRDYWSNSVKYQILFFHDYFTSGK
jgi:S-formylglutathione hydrolase FrmB